MLSSVTTYQLFNGSRELECFAKRGSFADLHNHARDTSRGRLFSELTKDASQILCAVVVHDRRRCETRLRIHPHVERAISHQTETALRVFELPGRNTQIKKRPSDGANPESVQDKVCVPQIGLPHDD